MGKRGMSKEYRKAMEHAFFVTQCVAPKLLERKPLNSQEGEELLNAQWKLYLCALESRDIGEAKLTIEFIHEIEQHLWLFGFEVLLKNNLYLVKKCDK